MKPTVAYERTQSSRRTFGDLRSGDTFRKTSPADASAPCLYMSAWIGGEGMRAISLNAGTMYHLSVTEEVVPVLAKITFKDEEGKC